MSKARQKQSDNAELRRLVEGMREEVARELGLPGVGSTEFADLSSKVCGAYGQKLWSRAQGILAQAQDFHQSDGRKSASSSENKNKKKKS